MSKTFEVRRALEVQFAGILLALNLLASTPEGLNNEGLYLFELKKSMQDGFDSLGNWNSSDQTPCGCLVHLTFLDLSDNGLVGGIPNEIGKCTSLERIYLNNNKFTGQIPSEVGKLSN
ncbi:hypothetical protein ACFX2I_022405 [Malus domestica]